jgi:NhaA family Na+:H+ antiporter
VADQNTSPLLNPSNPHPPGVWRPFRLGVQRILAPAEHFLRIEAASGIVLMVAALAALVWANSPWRQSYSELWHIPISFRFASFGFERDLHFWINDGLMTIFFFVVGLEIRREIHSGESSELPRASLPIAAAVGGMVAPAFALTGFGVMGLGILAILFMQLLAVRSALTYVAPGVVIWSGAYMAGIHPTLAGVILGFMTPVRARYGTDEFLNQTEARVRSIRVEGVSDDRALLHQIQPLQVANREAVSPVERLQRALHSWVAFGIMPLFAFANAGVGIGNVQVAGDAGWVFAGVTLGLLIGKPVGILTVSWLAVRLGVSALPSGVRWSHLGVVGLVGGIGFTMALFVAQLAFAPGSMLEIAKLGILCGSAMAGIIAVFGGYRILSPMNSPGIAKTETEAERSTTT